MGGKSQNKVEERGIGIHLKVCIYVHQIVMENYFVIEKITKHSKKEVWLLGMHLKVWPALLAEALASLQTSLLQRHQSVIIIIIITILILIIINIAIVITFFVSTPTQNVPILHPFERQCQYSISLEGSFSHSWNLLSFKIAKIQNCTAINLSLE